MFKKVILQGKLVRLEPLNKSHEEGLKHAIKDGELWKLFFTLVPHPDQLEHFFNVAEEGFKTQAGLTFATIDQANNKVIGSTRFLNSALVHKRSEIGFTFLAKSAQKSLFNTEAKLLMLTYAFENLELNRIAFLTDFLNKNSQRAIMRLGAKEEGMLRNHMVMPDGRIRDTMVYSIAKHEWPSIKQNLLFKLNQ